MLKNFVIRMNTSQSTHSHIEMFSSYIHIDQFNPKSYFK